ncbi:MAG: MinD/ParA family protein, partial [Anaerolineae bacterium]|nr:MinD/ParA family protein [Anaerolineae bacterium]
MAKVVSVHSFRGGTGKSNTTANLAALLAQKGLRVAVVDTDIQSPGIYVLLRLDESEMNNSLNDYLRGKCAIEEAAYDVTSRLEGEVSGKLYLVPSSAKTGDIVHILRESYDPGVLNDGLYDLIEALDLDVLMIDTHPGLNDETLLSITISEYLIIILRPDQQDFQGTSVTVEIAKKLDVPNMMLIVNKMPQVYDFEAIKQQVEEAYDAEVAALIPHSDEMMALGSKGV